MSERYKTLFKNDKPQLQKGIPVLLDTFALLGDTISGKVIAQLKFQNIGVKSITAVYAVLTCYDAMNSLVKDKPEAKYLDMDVAPGSFFGDRVPVVLPDNTIRSFSVRITSVRFGDGTTVKAEENTAFNAIDDPEISLTGGQIKQLEIEAKDRSIGAFSVSPERFEGKIRCACSQWNDESVEHCLWCGSDLKWLLEHSDSEVLQEHLEQRLKEEAEEEERRQEELRKQREERAALEKKKAEELRIEREKAEKEHAERMAAEEKKRKKRNKIIITVTSFAIIAGLIYAFVIKPKIDTKNKYQAALSLLDEKRYEEAAAEFEELGSYKDSENLLLRTDADKLYDAGKFSDAYEIYKELPEEYQIHEEDYQSKYSEAESLLSEGEFEEAAKLFDGIRGYSDSAGKVDAVYYTEAETAYDKGDFAGANAKFQKLGEYKDSASRAKQAEADGLYADGDYSAAYEIYAGLDEAYRTHTDDYAAMYDNAVLLMDNEDYAAAAAAFTEIESYSDSAEHIKEAYYKAGEAALSSREFETAKEMYSAAGEYQDSSEKIKAVENYENGLALQEAGSFGEAREAFEAAGILDSEARIEACCEEDYSTASELRESGDIDGAYKLFSTITDYKDSAEIVQEIDDTYELAAAYEEEGNYDDAILTYSSLKNYSDASAIVRSVAYLRAERMLEEGNYDKAAEAFKILGGYEDSADRVLEAHYKKAESLEEKGEKVLAAEEYAICGDYLDSADRIKALSLSIADEAFNAGDYGTALEYYTNLEQTDELKAREYELAQTCEGAGNYEQAVKAYEVLGEYELSVSRLPVARYIWAEQLQESGRYAEAAEQFGLLGDASDSKGRAQECTYLNGKQLMEEENYDEAIKAFESLGGYSDSNQMIKECTYRIAMGYLDAKDYEAARSVFEELGNYEDSAEKVKLCIYESGNLKYKKGDYAGAWRLYKAIKGYEDTDERILECDYQLALADYNAGNYDAALSNLTDVKDYKDSEDIRNKCHYELGQAKLKEGDTAQAVKELYAANTMPEAQELLYDTGKSYASTNQNKKAIETLWACGDYEPAKVLLEELGGLLIQNDQKEDGAIAYFALGDRDLVSQVVFTEKEMKEILSKYTLLGSNDFKNAIIAELEASQEDNITFLMEKGEYDKAYAIMEENGDLEAIADNKCERAKKLQDAGDKEAADKLFGEAFYEYMELPNCDKKAEEAFENSGVWVKSGRGYQIKVPYGFYLVEEFDQKGMYKSYHFIITHDKNDKIAISFTILNPFSSKETTVDAYNLYLKQGIKAELKSINNLQVVTFFENDIYQMTWSVPEKKLFFAVLVHPLSSDASVLEYAKKLSDMVSPTLTDETDDQVLYDNPNCYAAVYDVQSEDLSKGLQMGLLLENRASKRLTFAIENAWINGVEINPDWVTWEQQEEGEDISTIDLKGLNTLDAGWTSYSKITWNGDDLKKKGIEKIDEIRMLFTVTDSNNAVIHSDMLYIAP